MSAAAPRAGAGAAGPRRPVVLTTGEPAGCGPELCLRLAALCPEPLVLLGDRDLLAERAGCAGVAPRLEPYRADVTATYPALLHLPLRVPCQAGRPDPANGPYVLAQLDRAIDGCLSGEFAAMVTAPVQKSAIHVPGLHFSGHTEYLAERTGSGHVVMMLVGGGMRVALATTHLALRHVADAITRESLERTLRVLHQDLRRRFGIDDPAIVVAGLNPHAGEDGRFGREELEVIGPVLQALRAEGMRLAGPLPADTLFQARHLDAADAVLAMYHDQGLPVLKHASFGSGVNVTLGLPLVRTSVDHGTALDLAGTGRADEGSLRAALDLALRLAA